MIQIRFALSSSAVFMRDDIATDSERFYNSVLDFLDHPDEREQVDKLLIWWNRYFIPLLSVEYQTNSINSQIFPNYSSARRSATKSSILAKLVEQRARQRQILARQEN